MRLPRCLPALTLAAAGAAWAHGPLGPDQFWTVDSLGLPEGIEGSMAGVLASGDFNGDGYADLASGYTAARVFGVFAAGSVTVLYGSLAGLAGPAQLLTQGSGGIKNRPEASDVFGSALAAGDFDGDGHDDLAIGVPWEDLHATEDAGIVHVIYGSAAGLSGAADQVWHQDRPGILGAARKDDAFGHALVAGHFDADPFADLAIGVPGEDVGDWSNAGAVQVIYGTAGGLSEAGNQRWHQGVGTMVGDLHDSHGFGWALAAGRFDGGATDDLAVGIPRQFSSEEPFPFGTHPGAVAVIYGSDSGLTDLGNQLWHQDAGAVLEEAGDDFLGSTLTAADFDGDGFADLVIGVEEEDLEGLDEDTGAVQVLYGGASGLSDAGNQLWTQDSPGVRNQAEPFEFLGESLAAADLDGDGFAELVIGVPSECLPAQECDEGRAGAINILHGSAGGVTAAGDHFVHQNRRGISDRIEQGDESFGAQLAAGDFDGDGSAELVIAVPGDGAIHVLPGR